ncbi:hypothetical protein ACFQZI_01420 [Mucilaginibacter lutimaris]|uniref:Inner membrane protein n=1 Tax=Mucilaginibacter lutimaris TaxID=931629 RepID=A0ABW2Z9K1_9SPHI
MNNLSRIKIITLSASIIVFVISLPQYGFCTQSSCVLAGGALLTGWAAMYMGGVMLSWFANPLLLVAWVTLYSKSRLSFVCSIVATIMMLSFLCYKQIYNHQDEWTSDIVRYGLGYNLWVISGFTMVTGNALIEWHKQKLKN